MDQYGSDVLERGKELYWQLRDPDSPLPEDDRMEMLLLRRSQHHEIVNEKAARGEEFLASILWDLDRSPETLEDDEECERIGELFAAQPEVVDVFVAQHKLRNRLWIAALVRCEPGPQLRAYNLGEQIGRRLWDEFPWSTVELEDWERDFIYAPGGSIVLPDRESHRRYLELREGGPAKAR